MNQEDIWEELQLVLKDKLIHYIDEKEKMVPNLVIAMNIFNDGKKVKSS